MRGSKSEKKSSREKERETIMYEEREMMMSKDFG
jgi:hypothetical protein